VENESSDVAKWIEYHPLAGVDRFWIAENDSSDTTIDVLQMYCTSGWVTLSHAPGKNVQADSYSRWLPIIRI
jgi:hypothetical protein